MSLAIGQICKKISDLNGNTSEINIELEKLKKIKKLGIQAPSRIEFLINTNTIMIGTSGLYELEDDEIEINTISLKPFKNNNLIDENQYIIIDYVQEAQ